MILSEPTHQKNTLWLFASCDLCGLVCDFDACKTRSFYNPKGGNRELRPEGCKSEWTCDADPIVNDFIENHAVVCHRWKLVRDEEGKRFLVCSSCLEHLKKERAS